MERAVLTGVLRDLNTTLVADSMLRGRRVVYVDYVDYDAVAHHAGISQPESLDALAGIDAVLAQLEAVAAVAPRKYHLVVLSDHGQSQGEIFADRYGEDLATLVARLSDSAALAASKNDEGSGALNSMVAGSADADTVTGRAFQRASTQLTIDTVDTEVPGTGDKFLVFGSGNLGLVWVAGEKHRITYEELTRRWPALLPGLVIHPGVGFVVVETDDAGPVVLGVAGEHRLLDGTVTGVDPLAKFGPHAPEFVLRAATMAEAPDIYVNSLIDSMGEVAAFEGLVSCHGGLGGWQDRGMIVHPQDLELPEDMVIGADALHRVLVGWLEQLGHRADLRAPADGSADE